MAKRDTFFFTAQTGVWKLKRPKAPSNYHTYELPYSTLGKVQSAVRDSKVMGGGLAYPQEFVVWLEKNDLGGDDA
jgi:hypothetical protein